MSIELRPGSAPREAASIPVRSGQPGQRQKRSTRILSLGCLGLVLTAASCGKVGDPLPPIPLDPPPPFDLKSGLSPNRIRLSFSVSQSEIQAVQVLRKCGQETIPDALPDPVATLGIEDLASVESGRFSFETVLPPGATCFYSLRVILRDGRISGPSSWLRVPGESDRSQP